MVTRKKKKVFKRTGKKMEKIKSGVKKSIPFEKVVTGNAYLFAIWQQKMHTF